jgi:hypothetical protein
MHECPECGTAHEEPIVIEPEPAVEEIAEAEVRIAEVQADRDIKIAKIEAGVTEDITESRLAELEGQVRGMREVLDRIAPAPEPEPAPAPEPVITVVDDQADDEVPPKAEHHEPPRPKKSSSYFGF